MEELDQLLVILRMIEDYKLKATDRLYNDLCSLYDKYKEEYESQFYFYP